MQIITTKNIIKKEGKNDEGKSIGTLKDVVEEKLPMSILKTMKMI